MTKRNIGGQFAAPKPMTIDQMSAELLFTVQGIRAIEVAITVLSQAPEAADWRHGAIDPIEVLREKWADLRMRKATLEIALESYNPSAVQS